MTDPHSSNTNVYQGKIYYFLLHFARLYTYLLANRIFVTNLLKLNSYTSDNMLMLLCYFVLLHTESAYPPLYET